MRAHAAEDPDRVSQTHAVPIHGIPLDAALKQPISEIERKGITMAISIRNGKTSIDCVYGPESMDTPGRIGQNDGT